MKNTSLLALCVLLGCRDTSAPNPLDADVAPPIVLPSSSAPLLPRPRLQSSAPTASPDTRSAAQIEEAACTTPSGEWRCAMARPKTFKATTSTPIIPSSWTVPNWFFDPANSSGTASDSNNCTTSATACLTWGEIWVHRLGDGPQLQQVTTFNQLSAQTLNVDPIFGTFRLANGAQAILKGQLSQVCTIPINTATVTTQVRGGPGTRWAVSNPCVGEAAKMLIQDTTQNTWSTIDTVAGSATISQPLPNSVVSTVGIPTLSEGSMATNDAFTVWSQPLSNLKAWRVTGGDVGAGGANTAATTAWVQDIEVADSSGTGASVLPAIGNAAVTAYSKVRFDNRVHVQIDAGRGSSGYFIGCDFGQISIHFSGAASYYGGVARSGFSVAVGGPPIFDGDIVLHSTSTLEGLSFIGTAFGDGTIQTFGGSGIRLGAGGVLWGSTAITINPGSTFWNATGSAFATVLPTSGALKFGTLTTGFTSPTCSTFTLNGVTQVNVAPAGGAHFPANAPISWGLNTVGGTPGTQSPYFSAAQIADQFSVKSPTAGANDVYNWCAGPASVSITAANLDLYNGLQDINTGAKFSNTN